MKPATIGPTGGPMNELALYIIIGACSSIKKVTNRTPSNGYECAAGQAIQEPGDKHGLDVLSKRTRDEPDQEEEEGYDVDWFPAVELFLMSTSSRCRPRIQESENGYL